jgi:2-keto-4-pentenoate hydratase/2-oxohepta-3-ene-1,7-dioic acid hydratase in catechol pathway
MKLITYELEGRARIGLVVDGGIIDIGDRLGVRSIRELLEKSLLGDAAKLQSLRVERELASVKLLPVIPDAHHYYCVGVNYADHLKEVQEAGINRPTPKQPSLFIRFADTLIGHQQPMAIPKVSNDFDYEAELALIIGKDGRYIDKASAMDHVAGYSCFNDGSVRDWQFHTSQVTPGKNFLATGGFGPWMVTADEVPDPANLDIKLVLNGRVLQHSNTHALIFSIPEIIAYASAMVPLRVGDMIATGTPAGVGFSRKPPIFMKAGDICEVQIEKVGVLRNPIMKEQG